MSWRRDTAAVVLTGLLAVALGGRALGVGQENKKAVLLSALGSSTLPGLAWGEAVGGVDSGEVPVATASPEPLLVPPNGPYPQVIPYDVFHAALLAFGPEVDIALCIARAESQFRGDVRGAAGEASIWQLHPMHWTRYGTTAEALRDPYEAARVAAGLRLEAGSWRPWSTAGECL